MKDKWISTEKSKRRPKPEEHVLVFAPDCDIIGSRLIGQYFAPNNGYPEAWTVYDFAESKLSERVTHWQPLPEPPKPTTK